MRSKPLKTAAIGLVLLAVSVALAFRWGSLGDYPGDAGPPIEALVSGDPERFFADQALMGSLSLLVRAPFAALARLGDGSELLAYRIGALPCLVACGLVAISLWRIARRRGWDSRPAALLGAACLINPVTYHALSLGHPEELLGAALVVAAALAGRRHLLAGALLGLALATKQWAVIAFVPIVLAAPGGRLRVVAVSVAIAAALTLPLAIAGPESFRRNLHDAGRTPSIAGVHNVWWPLVPRDERVVFAGSAAEKTVTVAELPPWLRSLTHPLIVILSVPLSLALWRRARRPEPTDVLALLALLFLLRCLLDPVDNAYYHAPFLLSLAAWEARTRSAPLLTLLSASALWLSFDGLPGADQAVLNAVYLGWSVPLATWLALRLYAPATLANAAARLGLSRRLAPGH